MCAIYTPYINGHSKEEPLSRKVRASDPISF